MNQATYRAAIIGLGFIGAADQTSGDALGQQVENLDGTHLGALSGNPRIQLVAGSSRDPGRRSRFEERNGVRTYADWREMIATEALDLVSVATYTPVHEEITVACARSGVRAIYCEKPLASRIPEGEQMLQACRESGSLLAINHNRRFHPNYRRLRDLVGRGRIGRADLGQPAVEQRPPGQRRHPSVRRHLHGDRTAGGSRLGDSGSGREARLPRSGLSGPRRMGPDAPARRADGYRGCLGLRAGSHVPELQWK